MGLIIILIRKFKSFFILILFDMKQRRKKKKKHMKYKTRSLIHYYLMLPSVYKQYFDAKPSFWY